MEIEKCETAIKFKGVLKPDEIVDMKDFSYTAPGYRRSQSTYVGGNAQYQ
jgi:hypothetical protein